MNIGYLYFFLPAILFPLSLIIATSLGRKIGARKLSLYRQLTITIIGFPILLSILQKPELISQNISLIILCGLLGTGYLTIAFYAVNLTSVGISRSFVTVSRTLCSFVLGYVLFSENIGLSEIIGVLVIFLGVYIFSGISKEKLARNDLLGISFSLLGGILFTFNNLVFKKIGEDFSFIQTAYILEFSSLIPLCFLYYFTHTQEDFREMRKDTKNIGILFLTAPMVLLASYGLAQSVSLLPFYIFNTLFIIILGISMFFSWLFLGEKISFYRLISIGIMIVGCAIIII